MQSDKRIKIGLITYFKENYGSSLQCYATKKHLESLGIECEVIYENTKFAIIKRIKNVLFHLCKSVKYRGYFVHYLGMKKAMSNEKKLLTGEASQKINNFVDEYLHPKGYTWREICDLNKNKSYKAFVVGSDQIWNASIRIEPLYFLLFCDKEKRIAFAPSFGSSYIPSYNVHDVKKGLAGFERISVREETGKEIVHKFSNVECVRIADPTFLLTRDQWINFSERGYFPDYKYIFVHFLNAPSDCAIEYINRVCQLQKLTAVVFSYNHEKYRKIHRANHIDGDPVDYLSLILHSELVCTDSFHSTIFSVQLEKKFITFERQYLHGSTQSSRLKDMLNRFNLEKHFFTEEKQIESELDLFTCPPIRTIKHEHMITATYLDEEISKRIK